jgi:hypothetical protein
VSIDYAMQLWLSSCLRDEATAWLEFLEQNGQAPRNWSEFRTEFMNEYAPDYEDRLRREFMTSTQHRDEPITPFITQMDKYIDLLDPDVTSEERIRLILDRLHPKLKIYMLTGVCHTVAEMFKYAQGVQHDLARSSDYRPSPDARTCAEPLLAYRG